MPISATDRAKVQAHYLEAIHAAAQVEYVQKTAGWKAPKPYPLPIDPQGRVIVNVQQAQLSEATWKKLYCLANPDFPPEDALPAETLATFKGNFDKIIGHPIQPTTSVSLDLQQSHNSPIHAGLLNALEAHLPEKNKVQILDAYQGLAKGRIISLQQETHFHAHLIGRMVQAAVDKSGKHGAPGSNDPKFQQGLDAALLKINEKVIELQAKALEKAYKKAFKNNELDEDVFKKTLNKELDGARKKLLPEIAKTVRVELIKATEIQFTKDITKHLSKHLAEATSGSTHDYVHVDKGTGSINFIGANTHTSHHQELGGSHLADRMMYSHHLDGDKVTPLAQRQQVRVPSIAVKKLHPLIEKLLDADEKVAKKGLPEGLLADDLDTRIKKLDKKGKLSAEEVVQIKGEYTKMAELIRIAQIERADELDDKVRGQLTDEVIRSKAFDELIRQDTVDKIAHLQAKYDLGGDSRAAPAGALPNAFVYNLYTTLNKGNPAGAIDERSNKQSQSAGHILAAAHQYNRDNPGKPLCLVQNMAVNGWGHELSISNSNPDLVNEAALMTQMATLHTIYETLANAQQISAQQISAQQIKVKDSLFAAYTEFLASDSQSFYNYVKNNKPAVLTDLKDIKDKMRPLSVDTANVAGVEAHRAAFTANTKVALAALFKEGAFGHHDNGFTYQALSVFVEQASIGGCKSANERAQAVNGRVAILDFVSLDKGTRDKLLDNFMSEAEATRLKEACDNLENNISSQNTAGITGQMNALYESLNLEGFQAVISFIDQGGHAKLGTKGVMYNTNNSETVQTDVKNASKWQCHKGLTDNVLKEFCGIEKLSVGKELVNAAKKIFGGAAAGAIGALGAAGGVAIAVLAGASVAFPPLGIAVGIAVGICAAVGLVATLASVLPKLWRSSKSATEARFEALQEDNARIIKGEHPDQPKDDLDMGHDSMHVLAKGLNIQSAVQHSASKGAELSDDLDDAPQKKRDVVVSIGLPVGTPVADDAPKVEDELSHTASP